MAISWSMVKSCHSTINVDSPKINWGSLCLCSSSCSCWHFYSTRNRGHSYFWNRFLSSCTCINWPSSTSPCNQLDSANWWTYLSAFHRWFHICSSGNKLVGHLRSYWNFWKGDQEDELDTKTVFVPTMGAWSKPLRFTHLHKLLLLNLNSHKL